MRSVGHTEEIINVKINLLESLKQKGQLEDLGRAGEYVKMHVRETGSEGRYQIEPTQDRAQWRTSVITATDEYTSTY
jgi:hypothetical protein